MTELGSSLRRSTRRYASRLSPSLAIIRVGGNVAFILYRIFCSVAVQKVTFKAEVSRDIQRHLRGILTGVRMKRLIQAETHFQAIPEVGLRW